MKTEIIVVIYQRRKRLEHIINQFDKQTYKDFNLNIYNNTERDLGINTSKARLFHNKEKNNGAGDRFKIIPFLKGNPIIVLDDDEDITEDFVEYHIKEYEKWGDKCLLGWYSKTYKAGETDQRNEDKIYLPYGKEADVIGCGGMVVGRSLFDNVPELTDMKYPYIVNDMFTISALARMNGYKLISIGSKCEIIYDGKDTTKRQIKERQEAFDLLRKRGWKFLSEL